MMKTILMYEIFKLIKKFEFNSNKIHIYIVCQVYGAFSWCVFMCVQCMYVYGCKYPCAGMDDRSQPWVSVLRSCVPCFSWGQGLSLEPETHQLVYTLQPASTGTLLFQLPQHWHYKCTPLCPAFKWVLWLKLRYSCLYAKPRTMSTEPVYGVCIVLTALHTDSIGNGGRRHWFAYTLLPVQCGSVQLCFPDYLCYVTFVFSGSPW